MKLYLDRKIESIPIFRDLLILLKDFYQDEDIKKNILSIEDIPALYKLYDPVRDFIEFYATGTKRPMTADRINYIVNALYKAKGAPQIFDIMEELLEISVEWTYNFPEIEVLRLSELRLSDIPTFLDKLENALTYLLYFTKLKLELRKLTLVLDGHILEYVMGAFENYDIHNIISRSWRYSDEEMDKIDDDGMHYKEIINMDTGEPFRIKIKYNNFIDELN